MNNIFNLTRITCAAALLFTAIAHADAAGTSSYGTAMKMPGVSVSEPNRDRFADNSAQNPNQILDRPSVPQTGYVYDTTLGNQSTGSPLPLPTTGSPASVPEPSSVAAIVTGLAGLSSILIRRRK